MKRPLKQLEILQDHGVPGDVYCTACWAVFADADESLEAVCYEG